MMHWSILLPDYLFLTAGWLERGFGTTNRYPLVTEETPFEKGAPPRLVAEGLSLIEETDLSTVRDAKASFSLAGIPKL